MTWFCLKDSMTYLKLLRPRQWVKNFLIFVAIFFAKDIFIWGKLIQTIWAFVVFCLVASSVYIINDIIDKKKDRENPVKKDRPIASGQISSAKALVVWLVLLAGAMVIVFFKTPQIFWLILAYIILNFIYSFYLKNIPIFDMLLISGFYLLRIEVGGVAAGAPISRWLILCTIFVSLFVVAGKRFAESKHPNKREVLGYYTDDFLKHLLTISIGLSVVSYGLYSVLGVSSSWAVYSIFLVLLGMTRYLFLIYTSPAAEEPERLIFKDKVVLGSLGAWVIYMFFIFYR